MLKKSKKTYIWKFFIEFWVAFFQAAAAAAIILIFLSVALDLDLNDVFGPEGVGSACFGLILSVYVWGTRCKLVSLDEKRLELSSQYPQEE